PEPPPEAAPATGLEAVWNAAPFAPLAEPASGSEDFLFDPGTLGLDSPAAEGEWDPNAQPYDPNAAPYDPNAQQYDPNAPVYDPNGQPYDPNAQQYDAGAQGWDPNAPVYDPNAQQYDPNAPVYDPSAQPYDPNAAQWDAATQAAWDPSLAAPWGAETPVEAPAAEAPAAEAPAASEEPSWDAGLVAPEELAPELPATPEPALEPLPEASLEPWSAAAGEPGSYEDLSGPDQPMQVDALPTEQAQGLIAPLGEGQELTSDDDAFAQGFHLESNGSFGGALAPRHDPLEEVDVEEIPVFEDTELLEESPPEPAEAVRVEGVHRVVVHTVEGSVKRGVIADVTLDAGTLPLAPQPGDAPEELPTARVKAIFFMLEAGEAAPAPEGKKVRVTFTDGRQLAGFSPDYSETGAGFFMIPADTHTHTGRIWVYRSAVTNVAVS
ncbi:MAG: hypothetical protein WCC48_17745, partial [Anaeromyxobacteraceae bacterium]